QAAGSSKKFVTAVEVELGKGEHARLTLANEPTRRKRPSFDARSVYFRDDNDVYDLIDAPTFEQGMFNLAERWPGATLRLDTIEASGGRSPRGQQLLDLALAAWAEAFGLEARSPEELRRQQAGQQAEREKRREAMLKELRGGAANVKKWNARSDHERDQVGPLHGFDFKKANLAGIQLKDRDLQVSRFDGANLKKANLWSCKLQAANFARADLTGAEMAFIDAQGATFEDAKMAGCDIHIATLTNVNFRGADLTGAKLDYSDLAGADFTGAWLDGADLGFGRYDANTTFPEGF